MDWWSLTIAAGTSLAVTIGTLAAISPQTRQILIIEDQPAVQKWLAELVTQAFYGASVRCAESMQAAHAYARNTKPDLVLINMAIAGQGSDAVARLRLRSPHLPIAVICEKDDVASMASALKAGAAGCIARTLRAPTIVAALRLIETGHPFLPAQLIPHLDVSNAHELPESASALTQRQRELLRFVLKGHDNSTIANELGISVGTVKQHMNAIFKAIGVSSRAELLALAVRGGIRRDGSPITEVV